METAVEQTAGEAPAAKTALHIAVARSTILDALRRSVTAVAARATIPVLGMALIEAHGDAMAAPRPVKIITTDLDRRLESTFMATVIGSGKVLLPAKRLLEIVTSFPTATTVAIDVKGMNARVTAGRSRFDVLGLAIDEFPNGVDFKPLIERVPLEAKRFVDALSKVAPLVSDLESRPILGGILLDAADDGLYLVSTDGHRFGRLKLSDDASYRGESIIPTEAVAAIRAAFSNDETVTLSSNANQLRLEGKDSALQTRLIEGPYPNYRQLLGSKVKVTVIVNAALLVDAVKRVALVSPEKTRSIALMLKENEIRLVTNSDAEGTARDVVECRYDGDITAVPKIAVAANYIVNVIDAIGADENGEIALQLTGAERAIYVRRAKTPTSPSAGIVMPLRLLVDITDED
jgi:DNA polymerase-3 subunit beta